MKQNKAAHNESDVQILLCFSQYCNSNIFLRILCGVHTHWIHDIIAFLKGHNAELSVELLAR
jgi:hypothetical protein